MQASHCNFPITSQIEENNVLLALASHEIFGESSGYLSGGVGTSFGERE